MHSPYLRLMAGVLVRRDGKLLMQKRAVHKKLAPNQWAFPGGHVEPYELRTPRKTALRELWEETGLCEEQLASFGLRYVVLSPQGPELRVHFDYVAELTGDPVLRPNDEGELHWLNPEDIPALDMRPSTRALMLDYIARQDDATVKMGFLEEETMRWLATDASPEAAFRPAAGITARCGERLLMLRRAQDKEIAPGMWSNVGGHMEPEELNDPQATALREFEEEAGIPPGRLRDVALSGVVLVAKPHEFGMLFNYAAAMDEEAAVPDSEDGEFHWMRQDRDIANLPMTPAMKALALHAAARGQEALLGMVLGEDMRSRPWRPG